MAHLKGDPKSPELDDKENVNMSLMHCWFQNGELSSPLSDLCAPYNVLLFA